MGKSKTRKSKGEHLLIGFMRVSTGDQDLSLQRNALIEEGVERKNIFSDQVSGARATRPGLEACLKAFTERGYPHRVVTGSPGAQSQGARGPGRGPPREGSLSQVDS